MTPARLTVEPRRGPLGATVGTREQDSRPPSSSGRTVLVVEDDEQMRRVIDLTLLRNGFGCVTAETISGARWILSERSVDVVACDMHLPDGRGLDLLRDLAEQSGRQQAAVVMSGDHDPTLVAEAYELGYDYLFKPFGGDDLLLSIQRAMVRC